MPRWARAAATGAGLLVLLAGCGAPPQQLTDTDMNTFGDAGPVRFTLDYEQVLRMRTSGGPYRLVLGDLLGLQMPAVVRLLPDRDGDETKPYSCRVDSAGRIVLPVVGSLKVAGMTLPEVETATAKLYYPKYVRRAPSIVASVSEYRLSSVSVVGAVASPGVYELRNNEMTAITAIMKAGGIADEGATTIHIISGSSSKMRRSLALPVLDSNIPARDATVADGDMVIVEAMRPQAISVVGLVKRPGTYPWNPKKPCTVMEALAFAGGVNDLADPRYARVYRQGGGGDIVSALVDLRGPAAMAVSEICLKPGDIVAVEHTPLTRTRLFLSQIIRMGVGVNAGASLGP